MPDDTTPEPTAHDTPASDLTQSIPARHHQVDGGDHTADRRTPRSSGGDTASGAVPGQGADGGGTSSSQRNWIIALAAVAVLVVGAGIALAVTSSGKSKTAGDRRGEHPGPDDDDGAGPGVPADRPPAAGRCRTATARAGGEDRQLPRRPSPDRAQ